MRILFVGQLNEGQTTRMRMEALGHLGHDVRGVNEQSEWSTEPWWRLKMQQRLGAGPAIRRFNKRIVEAARAWKPDLLWAEKQEQLGPTTLGALRRQGIRLLHY